MSRENQNQGGSEIELDVAEIRLPQYRVILINDDYTTFEFVVYVLMNIFGKGLDEAERITMLVHQSGKGVAGTYLREIAEMKVKLVHELAQANDYPLQAQIE